MPDWDSILSYSAIKFITVKNKKLAILNLGLKFVVLIYVVAFTVVISKGYQKFDNLTGTVSPKVKGVGRNAETQEVFDLHDGVLPAVEPNALFVTTKFVREYQSRGVCPGLHASTESCDIDCAAHAGEYTENGINTGVCDESTGFCLIEAWCPVQDDSDDQFHHVERADKWTVFLKSNIRFPELDKSRTNALNYQGNGAPTFGINLFTVRDLIEGSAYEDGIQETIDGTGSTYEDMYDTGGIVHVTLEWDCNFDLPEDECEPEFTLKRTDNVARTISPGFNYRLSRTFLDLNETSMQLDVESRELTKLYGIRFIFTNTGQGGKFDFAQLTVTIGAGLALLGVSAIVCDFVMSNVIEEKDVINEAMEEVIDEEKVVKVRNMKRGDTNKEFGSDDMATFPANGESKQDEGSQEYDDSKSAEDKAVRLDKMRQLQAMGYSRDVSAQAVLALSGAPIEKAAAWADVEQKKRGSGSENTQDQIELANVDAGYSSSSSQSVQRKKGQSV